MKNLIKYLKPYTKESILAPLFKLLIGLTQSPDKLLATINYHLPSTYQKLLSAAFAA